MTLLLLLRSPTVVAPPIESGNNPTFPRPPFPALIFPRPIPWGVQTVEFELMRAMAQNRLYGGATQVREMAEPRWRGQFGFTGLMRADYQRRQAWLDSLRGGARAFLGHDPLKPYPAAHPGGKDLGGWDGTAGTSGVSAYGFSAYGLPSGMIVTAGDMVGLTQAGRYGLYRVLEDAVSSGGSVGLQVEPRINTDLFGSPAQANFVRASCLMVLEPGSVSASRSAGSAGQISFAGVQKIT